GNYAADGGALNNSIDNGPLHAPSTSSVSGNGVYTYGVTQFPTNTYNATNYWVDVVYNTNFVDTVPPSVTARAPAAGATLADPSSAVTATFSKSVVQSSIQLTLKDAGGAAVAGSLGYNDTNFTATFTPSAALARGATYTANLSGATDHSGNVMTAASWSFTTAQCC